MSNYPYMTLHTFELSLNITKEEEQICRDYFYTEAAKLCIRCFDKNGWLNFYGYQKAGIKISLRSNVNTPGALIRLRINPSVLCGDTDPTALFLPDRKNMNDMIGLLDALTHNFLREHTIYDFTLNRLDLCRNIYLEKQEYLAEYLRLLHKRADQLHWDAERFGDERDDHSFRRYRTDYEVTVYDKIYELQQEDRSRYQQESFQWTRDERILRVETSLLRNGIRSQIEKRNIDRDIVWPDLLLKLSASGLFIMTELLDLLIPDSTYYSLDAARILIALSDFREHKKEKLGQFLYQVNRNLTLDRSKLQQEKNGAKRLRQLNDLNINPVTIESRARIDMLPSIQDLLKMTCV